MGEREGDVCEEEGGRRRRGIEDRRWKREKWRERKRREESEAEKVVVGEQGKDGMETRRKRRGQE